MADKRLIDNSSSTTVDNFYGNKNGADVQIPLAQAASVLAGSHRTSLQTTSGKVSIDVTPFKSQMYVIGYGGDTDAGRRGLIQIITEGGGSINWVAKPYQWDTFFSNEQLNGNVFSVDCSNDWFYFLLYPL